MKAIVIGDPHFRTDNIPEVNLFMDKIEDLAKTENPDIIVVLGDVLHTHERLHTIPLNKAYEFIEKMRNITKTFVLVGNHDMCNNQQFLTTNHWMNGMKQWKNVEIVDTVIHRTVKGIRLVFCPYVPPGKFQEALNSNTEADWKKADCIFAHQEFYGCKMGAIVSVEGDKWPKDYPRVISGHIHSRQVIQDNVYYCGSSMQNAFGESDKNIIPIVTWAKNKAYNLEEVDLELPRKKIIYTDVQSMEDYEQPDSEDKIKISISGVYDEFKAFKKTKKYRELVKKGTKIVFKPKKIKNDDEKETTEMSAVEETDFNRILSALISKEKSPFLYQVFELVVNNKTVEEEDILFL